MSGVSLVLGGEYNFSNVESPQAPRPPTKPAEAPKPAPVAIPVVLPSADVTNRTRNLGEQQTPAAVQPQEWRGVSALSSLDHNVAAMSLSPTPIKKEPAPAKSAEPPKPPPPIPVVLPGAQYKKQQEEKQKSPLQPLTSWGGVSSQVQDEYNHKASPDTTRPPEAYPVPSAPAPPAETPAEKVVVPVVEPRSQAPAAVRSRGASKDYAGGAMEPLANYSGIASSLADEAGFSVPSPELPRRSRTASKETEADATAKVEPPAAPKEEAVDEYAFDIATLKAQREALSKGPQNRHHGFSPLSSIVG